MNKLAFSAFFALAICSSATAAVSISHTQIANAQILTSAGTAPAAGGVSVGFFSSPQLDTIFQGKSTFADLLAAGFQDVRSLAGVTGTPDWNFPLPVSGTVSAISTSLLPTGTQLYIVAYNAGSFANNFSGSTEWAVIKDNANLAPADLSPKSTALSTVTAGEVLFGTDNANNVNMVSLVPEPSRMMFGILGVIGLLIRRRR